MCVVWQVLSWSLEDEMTCLVGWHMPADLGSDANSINSGSLVANHRFVCAHLSVDELATVDYASSRPIGLLVAGYTRDQGLLAIVKR